MALLTFFTIDMMAVTHHDVTLHVTICDHGNTERDHTTSSLVHARAGTHLVSHLPPCVEDCLGSPRCTLYLLLLHRVHLPGNSKRRLLRISLMCACIL